MTYNSDTFDLLEQPWIQAVDTAAQLNVWSLRDVFGHAHELVAVVGELPTQSFAILRLLLAILRRSLAARPGGAAEIWNDLWQAPTLPTREIGSYLDTYADRFGLFDPAQPFYQVADLRSEKDAVSGLDRLIADVPNGEKYFTTRAGASIDRIDFAEAARWLVHAQAFDPSGIKTGAVGDPRMKNGKGYPIGVAWAGSLGGVYVEGATLRETLLLNLNLLDIHEQPYPEHDLPAWERAPDRAHPRDAGPTGPADLCTWQSRRVRLVRDGGAVTGVVLCNGDALAPFNQQLLEPMTGWRYSTEQSKKADSPRHYPRTHDPARALWRGFTALLREVASGSATDGRGIAPGVMEWVRYLIDEEVLVPTHPLRLHAVGMEYINNLSVIGEIVDDTLGFRAALLARDPALRTCAINAVEVAEGAVNAVGSLAGNLAEAAGATNDPVTAARARPRELAYAALEGPYRRWLAALEPGATADGYDRYSQEWQNMVRAVIEPLGRQLVSAAGMPALVGREVRGRYVDSALASIWFRAALAKLLPAAYPKPSTGKGQAA
ncbi:CRISPR system Cascade subunit CasA [Nocardia sp. GAS34]|uniref:type I-E CRISPR-associated protein Cse1/CasA n=1 Tax=unclassified Nocardia TaxID=2637762 RepID=UPI003D246AD9